MTVSALQAGIKTNLQTISGLRTSDYVPDNVNPPVAVVMLQNINYDNAFAHGMNTYTFGVSVIVPRVSERTAQSALNAYVSSTGSSSIKRAIESDKTLNGSAYDVRVSEVRNYGEIVIGDVNYFSAEFVLLCYAD